MAYIIVGALAIGLTLGLLGSGGSILTVPVLVYLLGHHEKVAIAESLAIVGSIALVGMLPYARSRQIDWRSVVFFGVPGMAGTFAGAWLAKFVSGPTQLILFGGVMLAAAWLMFRRGMRSRAAAQASARMAKSRPRWPISLFSKKHVPAGPQAGDSEATRQDAPHKPRVWVIAIEGLCVGMMTGLVGVGGGFLIVPALVILGGLSMRLAVGTSLTIIALNSYSGFYKYLGTLRDFSLAVDWTTIWLFVAIGAVGSIAGRYISTRVNQTTLQIGFSAFLVLMGVFVLAKEIPHAFEPTKSTHVATDCPTVAEVTESRNSKSQLDKTFR